MIYRTILLIALTLSASQMNGQNSNNDTLPYYEIKSYPESNRSSAVLQRLIDGLGYRFYWSTEGLTEADWQFKYDCDGCRSISETVSHIYDLTQSIYLFAKNEVIERGGDKDLSDVELRSEILNHIQSTSELLSQMDDEAFYNLSLKFRRGERESEFPLWHVINGQISDAIYHVGQIVMLRRAGGNPINPETNVFTGRKR